MQRFAGYGFVAVAALLWALLGPVAKAGYAVGMQPYEIGFWRAIIGAVVFMIHARCQGQNTVERKDIPAFVLFGATGIGLFFASYLLAIEASGAAVASILLYTAPIWVAVQARLFFKEKITLSKLTALSLALGGTVLVCVSATGGVGATVGFAGIFWGLVAGFSYSLQYVFGKAYLQKYSSATIYGWCLPVGALAILPWVNFSSISATYIGVVLAQGVLSTYMANYAYCEGLKRLETTRVAIVANLEPVVATVFAYIWWDETLGVLGYLGGALVVGAVLLMVQDKSPAADAA